MPCFHVKIYQKSITTVRTHLQALQMASQNCQTCTFLPVFKIRYFQSFLTTSSDTGSWHGSFRAGFTPNFSGFCMAIVHILKRERCIMLKPFLHIVWCFFFSVVESFRSASKHRRKRRNGSIFRSSTIGSVIVQSLGGYSPVSHEHGMTRPERVADLLWRSSSGHDTFRSRSRAAVLDFPSECFKYTRSIARLVRSRCNTELPQCCTTRWW